MSESSAESASRALLPTGLRDLLPPRAGFEADVVERLIGVFARSGYERVAPPLLEFEDSLLADAGPALAAQALRLMDPASRRMMGLRVDMTGQVCRVATTRLTRLARPLRLSYAGQVVRAAGSQLRPDRQFTQAGLEMIGPDSAPADAEVLLLVVEALAALDAPGVSIDLTLPPLVPAVQVAMGLDGPEHGWLTHALDQKDAAAVARLGGEPAAVLGELLAATGPADRAMERLYRVPLPAAGAALRDRLAAVIALVRAAEPDLTLTVDPVERRGFAYHTGLSFQVFSRRSASHLGRGGRYLAGGGAEPAFGGTLFMDAVLGVLEPPAPPARLYLPAGVSRAEARRWHSEGWATVAALASDPDPAAAARAQRCSHLLDGSTPRALDPPPAHRHGQEDM